MISPTTMRIWIEMSTEKSYNVFIYFVKDWMDEILITFWDLWYFLGRWNGMNGEGSFWSTTHMWCRSLTTSFGGGNPHMLSECNIPFENSIFLWIWFNYGKQTVPELEEFVSLSFFFGPAMVLIRTWKVIKVISHVNFVLLDDNYMKVTTRCRLYMSFSSLLSLFSFSFWPEY